MKLDTDISRVSGRC